MMGTGLNSQFGIAVESTVGTYATVDRFLEFNQESIQYNQERMWPSGLRPGRRTRSGFLLGTYDVNGQSTHELTAESQGILWELAFGTVNTSGAGPYTHVFTPGALSSASVQIAKPGDTILPHTFLGMRVQGWTLDATVGQIPTLRIDWQGTKQDNTESLETASYSTLTRLSFTQGVFTVAGSEVCVDDVSIVGNNNLNVDYKICSDTPGGPTVREADYREYTGSATADFVDNTQYNRFVNGDNVALSLVFSSGTSSLTVAGNVEFDGETPNVTGPEVLKQPIPFTFYSPTSDAAAITATLINSDSAA